jgi:hypothetical protein
MHGAAPCFPVPGGSSFARDLAEFDTRPIPAKSEIQSLSDALRVARAVDSRRRGNDCTRRFWPFANDHATHFRLHRPEKRPNIFATGPQSRKKEYCNAGT